MKRILQFVVLLAALFLFVFTMPNLRLFQGPFVTRADGPGPATSENFTVEITRPPVVADSVSAAQSFGEPVTAPACEKLLVVAARAAALGQPVQTVTFRVHLGEAVYAPVAFSTSADSLDISTLQPDIWLGGSVVFRVPEEALRAAEHLEFTMQSSNEEQFAEQVILRLDATELEWEEPGVDEILVLPTAGYAGVVE